MMRRLPKTAKEDASTRPPQPVRWLWLLGFAGLACGHGFLIARVEPFYSAVYTFLWWPFIFAVDGLVYRLKGRSLLRNRPREFLLLALWSTPVWLLFEAINLRIANWHYVQSPSLGTPAALFLLAAAFATVLPAIFEVTELVTALLERATRGKDIRGRPFEVTPRNLRLQTAIGVVMLLLTLIWPHTFFCLTWGFAFFLLDPLCYARGGRSLLGRLAAGENTRLVALLLSGILCGGLWEVWNVSARSKWIYTVPGFETLKLGEMPLLGFLGFPPFVLECYALVNALSLLRRGRHWEKSGKENRRSPGMPLHRAVWMGCIVSGLSLAVAAGVFRWTVSSYALPLREVLGAELGPGGLAALERAEVTHTHQFLDTWGPPGTGKRGKIPAGLEPGLFRRIRALSVMAELKGMGLRHALALEAMGVRTPGDLADWSPAGLSREMARRLSGERPPSPERVRVWILAARRGVPPAGL